MEPIVLIVVALVAVVVVAAVVWKMRKPALPPPSEAAEAAERSALPTETTTTPAREEAKAAPAVSTPATEATPTSATSAPSVVTQAPPKVIPTPPAPKPLGDDDEATLLRKGLGATRGGLVQRLRNLFSRKPEIDPATLEEIEEILLTSDVGVKTTSRHPRRLRERLEQQRAHRRGTRLGGAPRGSAHDSRRSAAEVCVSRTSRP